MNGTMMGFTKEQMDEKLQEILDFADIGDFVHQPVKSYSSGMFVRLAFALYVAMDPSATSSSRRSAIIAWTSSAGTARPSSWSRTTSAPS